MKTIYICTRGECSEYQICGVFDNKDLADEFCQKFGCEVEEWDLNPLTTELERGYSHYFVKMSREGEALLISG